jgi:squalene-hopene/tetraprenyl-beta-curcumene cyclase
MNPRLAGAITFFACTAVACGAATAPAEPPGAFPAWNVRAAAAYLDGRADWWVHWPSAARDHETACVSCHTALPYLLARQALRAPLGERDLAPPERAILANVVKRVSLWKEVEPFYPDQTRGLPKSSESRGTEAVMNALILATRDAPSGTLSADAQQAFDNLWPLQFKAGDLKGAWAWLNFHYEPWESTDATYFGGVLAALAVGTAPGGYATRTDVQGGVTLLREYLRQHAGSQPLLNRAMLLWVSAKLDGVLDPAGRDAIVDALVARQHHDGGWSTSDLGTWKRIDRTPLDRDSDGYATAIVALALQAGRSRKDQHVAAALRWLDHHQDAASGSWYAASLNKQRELASDAGKFMSDAATAYAVLALTGERSTAAGSAPPQ